MTHDQRGFTLLELNLVLAVIGILAALAMPEMAGQTARARRTEARQGLAALWTAEKAWYQAHGDYTTDFRSLAFAIEGGHVVSATQYQGQRYTYQLSQPGGAGTFYATATGNIDGDDFLDVLVLRQRTAAPWVLYDDVANAYTPEPVASGAPSSGGGTSGGGTSGGGTSGGGTSGGGTSGGGTSGGGTSGGGTSGGGTSGGGTSGGGTSGGGTSGGGSSGEGSGGGDRGSKGSHGSKGNRGSRGNHGNRGHSRDR